MGAALMSVSVDALADEVTKVLQDFGEAFVDDVDMAVGTVARHAQQKLRDRSPKGLTGDYAKGWTVKNVSKAKSGGYASAVVHNATDYQLTHLLENPHAVVAWGHRTGRMSTPQPHIAQVQQEAQEEFEAFLREAGHR